ncbi:hypothetical protein [Actinosynnema pretiosum]|nr:hypothetical protein [Actinosynnema pretiosum]
MPESPICRRCGGPEDLHCEDCGACFSEEPGHTYECTCDYF